LYLQHRCLRNNTILLFYVILAHPLQELRISYLDPTLLLPVVVEHAIDERSPLAGHTQQSLEVGPTILQRLHYSK
jgi:hypothetical protein